MAAVATILTATTQRLHEPYQTVLRRWGDRCRDVGGQRYIITTPPIHFGIVQFRQTLCQVRRIINEERALIDVFQNIKVTEIPTARILSKYNRVHI
jgi:hypothetical protein